MNLARWILISSAAVVGQLANADFCSEQKLIELDFNAGDFSELRVNALAGDLFLEGNESSNIEVRGIACTDRTIYLDRMDINVDKDGDALALTVNIPYHEDDWHADYAYIDLTVTVPSTLKLFVKDSSGDIEAEDTHIALINDSSGDIRLRDTTGSTRVRDSSGSVSVKRHRGELELQDSSGDLEIADVDGSVTVLRDSSGDIEIDTVTGFVAIERDSSGDIEIESVSEYVNIGANGSGSIEIEDVNGSVEIGADGSGDVVIQRVNGDFILRRKGSGDIRTARIQGSISIPEH